MNKFEIDSDCADRLIREQRSVWALLDKNCQALERVETRIVFVEGVPVTLQFNPERIRSAAAVVDRQSIQNRKCFLCEENQTGGASRDYCCREVCHACQSVSYFP